MAYISVVLYAITPYLILIPCQVRILVPFQAYLGPCCRLFYGYSRDNWINNILCY